ncbi:restriction endonuclease [Vibrio vulnificus]|nr:restriction endonuclease [Vibrio vulnificus]ELH4836992.1 restriction endonuclease [Vibrio harveyi]EGQ7940935.1 restriction endonuclease [Vibrio vulnificus]EGQ8028752.1 restriction endonuclease [Vibrio vulnificus]EGQ9313502.1 restriction endonuclease [Vibrio vulnificus]EHI9279496.1 restriction endonuclease [Vibrio vulnificus]
MNFGFSEWVKNNLSHLFSLVGIVLTVYFSVWYVPQYSEELKLRQIENTHNELVSTIQELVYNGHEINEHNIDTLVSGKEVKYNVKYPYTKEELLVQVQEAFLSNRFIPLDVRKSLVDKVDLIRDSLTKSTQPTVAVEKATKSILALVSGILGVMVSILGVVSLIFTTKRQRKNEIDQRVSFAKDRYQESIKREIAFENKVFKVLVSLFGRKNTVRETERDIGVDFVVQKDGKGRVGIVVKDNQHSSVSLNQVRHMISISGALGFPLVLVTNSPLSTAALEQLERFNARGNESGQVIVCALNDLAAQLDNFV